MDKNTLNSQVCDKNFTNEVVSRDGLMWVNAHNSNIKKYGFNWYESDKKFTRLPDKYAIEVNNTSRNVAFLATNTSSGQLHFRTNSSKVVIHAKLDSPICVSGMSAVGQCGFDCYVGKDYDTLQFIASTTFDMSKLEYTVTVYQVPKECAYDKLVVINFPLYAAVGFLEIGLDEDATLSISEFPNKGRIVLYGTSITQGGCANRPGLSYANILSRKTKREFLNYGFSGNAFGENIFAKIISEIDNVDLYYINFEANGGTNGKLEENLESFIKTIRSVKPFTPIIICSRIVYIYDTLVESLGTRREELRLFQENLVKKFASEGDKNIYYLDGSKLFEGSDYDFSEYTVDSIHPNDAGFMLLAKSIGQMIKSIIK